MHLQAHWSSLHASDYADERLELMGRWVEKANGERQRRKREQVRKTFFSQRVSSITEHMQKHREVACLPQGSSLQWTRTVTEVQTSPSSNIHWDGPHEDTHPAYSTWLHVEATCRSGLHWHLSSLPVGVSRAERPRPSLVTQSSQRDLRYNMSTNLRLC